MDATQKQANGYWNETMLDTRKMATMTTMAMAWQWRQIKWLTKEEETNWWQKNDRLIDHTKTTIDWFIFKKTIDQLIIQKWQSIDWSLKMMIDQLIIQKWQSIQESNVGDNNNVMNDQNGRDHEWQSWKWKLKWKWSSIEYYFMATTKWLTTAIMTKPNWWSSTAMAMKAMKM